VPPKEILFCSPRHQMFSRKASWDIGKMVLFVAAVFSRVELFFADISERR
jgi:hypothetical protein